MLEDYEAMYEFIKNMIDNAINKEIISYICIKKILNK